MRRNVRAFVQGKHTSHSLTEAFEDLGRAVNWAKRESLREVFERIRIQAIENIVAHSQTTGVKASPTGPLANSIAYDVDRTDRGRMYVGNEATPYAAMHNEGNQDGKTLILPTNGRYLVFLNHRTGKINRRRFVFMPSFQYFTRAWTSHIDDFPEIFQQKIEEQFG